MAERPVPHPAAPSPADPEVLDTGQEEVFSRTEVELGLVEHGVFSGSHDPPPCGAAAPPAGQPTPAPRQPLP